MLDFLIVNGQYPDEECQTLLQGNIGIEAGKIAYIGTETPAAKQVIDAKDRVVSPGFIDFHMHEETLKEVANGYCIANYALKEGVTTCVGGNCGIMRQTVAEFRKAINDVGGSPVHYAMLSGYNKYREELVPNPYNQTTGAQRDKIRASMAEDLRNGAFGISFGIEYDPAMTYQEILYACGVCTEPDQLVTTHIRSDSIGNIDAVEEVVDVQLQIPQKLQLSHLGSASAHGMMKKALDCINEARKVKPQLRFDTYPYDAFATGIGTTVFDDGCFEQWGKTYSDIWMLEEPYRNQWCTKEIFEEARAKYPEMTVAAFVLNSDEISMAIADPDGMVASDGIMNDGMGHPRCAGTFPRLLGLYVREQGVLPLVDALRKITLMPAQRLGVEATKGVMRVGADADVTVFDPATIRDGADFSDLTIPVQGVEWVFVDGKLALHDNRILGNFGHFLDYHDYH